MVEYFDLYKSFDQPVLAGVNLTVESGETMSVVDNVSNARSRGLEVSAEWRATWGLQATAANTWLDTEVSDGDTLLSLPAMAGG